MRDSTFQPLFCESLSSSQDFQKFPERLKQAVLSQRQGTGTIGMNLLKNTLTKIQRFTATQRASGSVNDSMDMDSSFPSNTFDSESHYSDFPHFQTTQELTSEGAKGSQGQGEESSNILTQLRKRFYGQPSQGVVNYYAVRTTEKYEANVEKDIEKHRKRKGEIKLSR